ncbi:serine hydrolase domain-containing protein [Limosilactobacillus mucosae]
MRAYQNTIRSLNTMVESGIVPGISWAIFEGQETLKNVTGLAQLQPQKEALKDGMLYDVASLTKVVGTIPLIMQLKDEGQLDWDDPVVNWLPELNDDRATIRNLITHTSSIEGYIPRRDELPADELTKEMLDTLRVGPNLNKQIRYADVGLIYVGWIAEKILGEPVQTAITERILKPLQLKSATFAPDPKNCVPTEIKKDRGLIRGQTHDPKAYVLGKHCGSAGLFATLDDLLQFSHALLETNLNGLVKPETIASLFYDQTPMNGEHLRSFGWKLFHSKTDDRHFVISHTGYTGTWMILDKQTDQGMIVLTNRVHPSADNQAFLDARDRLFATYLNEKDL